MRCIVALLLFLSLAYGQDSVAPGTRWVEPRGTSAGSYRSRARAVVQNPQEAWSFEPGEILTPIVHWGGIGYVIARERGRVDLVAFRLDTGATVARAKLLRHVEGTPLLVWDGLAVHQAQPGRFDGWRLVGDRLQRKWYQSHRNAPVAAVMTVLDGELHYEIDGHTYSARLDRTGRSGIKAEKYWGRVRPKPTAPVPTLLPGYRLRARRVDLRRGADVEVDGHTRRVTVTREVLALVVEPLGTELPRDREERARVAPEYPLKPLVPGATGADEHADVHTEIWVGVHHIFLRPERAFDNGKGKRREVAMVPYRLDSGRPLPQPGAAQYINCLLPPVEHELGMIGLGAKGARLAWALVIGPKEGWMIARSTESPELFKDRTVPVLAGHVAYFGAWACDLKARKLAWKLDLAGRVTAPAVPADGLVLLVTDHRVVHAFRESR